MATQQVPYDNRKFWSEFIQLYQDLPVLWTKMDNDEEKHNKHLRDRALNILLRKYRDAEPTANVNTIKKVLKSLHSSYLKELRMEILQERMAGNDCKPYEPHWWCFGKLNFLRTQEEPILKQEIIKEEDANISDHEDDLNTYCKDLAEAMTKLSEEQLRFFKHHVGTILYFANMSLLTREWPQLPSPSNSNLTPNIPEQEVHKICTVKGIVQFGKRDSSTSVVEQEQKTTKRFKQEVVNDEFVQLAAESPIDSISELYGEEHKEDIIMVDQTAVEEDVVFGETEDAALESSSHDDKTHLLIHRLPEPEDRNINLENIEITLIDLQDDPEDSAEQDFSTAPKSTETSDDTISTSIRIPPRSKVRRQCTMHSSSYVNNIVSNYNDEEFLRQFRMGRDMVEMLCQHLEKTYAYKKLKGHGGYEAISAQTHVLAFLWFLGHKKSSYREVADRFELSVSCLHDVIWRVCDTVLAMKAVVIVQPDEERKAASASHFAEVYSIPGVIGCIGGMQIKIDKPIENADRYLLRKGYYSMQLQAIVDEQLHFVDIFVEYPGEPEMLAGVKELCSDQYRLLGGNEYPCLPQMLVPYRTDGIPLTEPQELFNEQLRKAQDTCITVFQRLKQRFRQLHHLKGRQLSRVVKLIKVCCILHNLSPASEMALIDRETPDRRTGPFVSVPVFTYTSENQTESDVALGQQYRDTICKNFRLDST
ncbi:uncharacterized protein LOC131272701 isoform X2 [Anopheles coustani]|uniref:uncharacterized protein LOC131272701 isoform X2 n=1 Tax=Anopheles coustani TaxID=139045 RepID=UPI00265AF474|nr:uncharacterized protein LOC131272701 isoform X2 [Anopheles coustani]